MEVDNVGCVCVGEDFIFFGYLEIFVIGDIVNCIGNDGWLLLGVVLVVK